MGLLQLRLSWRAVRWLAAGIIAVSAVALLSPGLGAVLPQGQVAIATAGADASYQVMLGILPNSNTQYNIPAIPTSPYHVEGDANCPDVDWVSSNAQSGQKVAPSGATAALDQLKAEETNGPNGGPSGCFDIARSSSPPRGTAKDGTHFEYYAFALDAVSWASPATSKMPAAMTLQTLQGIYNCTITDWANVPGVPQGTSGPIQRYFAQTGSGTGSFFQSDLLGGQDPTTVSNANCPAVKRILQSEGQQIDPADMDKAILPYSVGGWIYQKNNTVNPTIDVSNGVQLGALIVNGSASSAAKQIENQVWQADTAGVVNESNVKVNNSSPTYPGIRYLFNVIDNLPLPNYNEAFALIGFDNIANGTKSPLCSGQKASPILSYGLGTLTSSGNPSGHNAAGSTCRLYTNS